jgi:hypothetical protein
MANLPEQIQKQVDAAQAMVDAQRVANNPEPQASTTQEPVAAVKPQEQNHVDDQNSQTYAQRWRSLQGIHNSTKQRLDALEAQNQELQRLVSTMQTAPVTNMANKQFLTDQDMSEYGADMVDVMRRAAREELKDFAGAVGSLKQDIDGLRQVVPAVQQLSRETQVTAQERFFADLARAVPDYEQVNNATEFRQWLLTPDPMTGILRQTYLVDAQKTGDVGRVANIFNTWKSLSGTQGQTNARLSPQQELERQQAPSRNLTTAPVENQGRLWDPREISEFYDQRRKGQWAGREAEYKALEQDIFKAQKEGRIVRKAA